MTDLGKIELTESELRNIIREELANWEHEKKKQEHLEKFGDKYFTEE
jgi:hypothetical protein